MVQAVKNTFEYVINQILSMGFFDIADVVIVSVLFYYIYKFVRERRAGKLAVGILFILVVMVLSGILNMYALNFIISNIVQVGIIGIIILFQSELRSFLEKVGGEPLKSITSRRDIGVITRTSECIGIIADAVTELSAEKTATPYRYSLKEFPVTMRKYAKTMSRYLSVNTILSCVLKGIFVPSASCASSVTLSLVK